MLSTADSGGNARLSNIPIRTNSNSKELSIFKFVNSFLTDCLLTTADCYTGYSNGTDI